MRFPNVHFSLLDRAASDLGAFEPLVDARPNGFCTYDAAQLPADMAMNQSEFNWFVIQGQGQSTRGPRRFAALFCLHCTGARVSSVSLGPSLMQLGDLPAPLRWLGPSWLPVVAPFRVALDSRPLFLVALYDLDQPQQQPRCFEVPLEHEDFDAATFSIASPDGRLQLQQFSTAEVRHQLPQPITSFFAANSLGVALMAQCEDFELEFLLRPTKPVAIYGPNGVPRIEHGAVTMRYFQRPRFDVIGRIGITSEHGAAERIERFSGDGCQDRQWLTVTRTRLKWLWAHVRLSDGRELTCYVIRDSSSGKHADANEGDEVGRSCWLVTVDGEARSLPDFDLCAAPGSEQVTDRGTVPTRFELSVPELELKLGLDHIIAAPYLRMKAFGEILNAGMWEGPARITDPTERVTGHGWVEVMNSASARLA